jgi:hypothetical protein
LQRCIHALMFKKLLNLLDGPAIIDGHCCRCTPELVRMDLVHVQLFPQFAQPNVNTAS